MTTGDKLPMFHEKKIRIYKILQGSQMKKQKLDDIRIVWWVGAVFHLKYVDQCVMHPLNVDCWTNVVHENIRPIDQGSSPPCISVLEATKLLIFTWNDVA